MNRSVLPLVLLAVLGCGSSIPVVIHGKRYATDEEELGWFREERREAESEARKAAADRCRTVGEKMDGGCTADTFLAEQMCGELTHKSRSIIVSGRPYFQTGQYETDDHITVERMLALEGEWWCERDRREREAFSAKLTAEKERKRRDAAAEKEAARRAENARVEIQEKEAKASEQRALIHQNDGRKSVDDGGIPFGLRLGSTLTEARRACPDLAKSTSRNPNELDFSTEVCVGKWDHVYSARRGILVFSGGRLHSVSIAADFNGRAAPREFIRVRGLLEKSFGRSPAREYAAGAGTSEEVDNLYAVMLGSQYLPRHTFETSVGRVILVMFPLGTMAPIRVGLVVTR